MSGEDSIKKLCEKLGNLYQLKSMVNKLFLRKKLYLMRMSHGDLVIEHLNVFNTFISHLLSIDIKIIKEEKCVSLSCSLSDSWDSIVMFIGSNNTTLKLEYVVVEFLLEEMRWKNMEGSNPKALSVRGQSIIQKKGKLLVGDQSRWVSKIQGQRPLLN